MSVDLSFQTRAFDVFSVVVVVVVRPAGWPFSLGPADHAKTPRRALDDMMMVSRARQTFVIVPRSRRRSFPIVVSNARLLGRVPFGTGRPRP